MVGAPRIGLPRASTLSQRLRVDLLRFQQITDREFSHRRRDARGGDVAGEIRDTGFQDEGDANQGDQLWVADAALKLPITFRIHSREVRELFLGNAGAMTKLSQAWAELFGGVGRSVDGHSSIVLNPRFCHQGLIFPGVRTTGYRTPFRQPENLFDALFWGRVEDRPNGRCDTPNGQVETNIFPFWGNVDNSRKRPQPREKFSPKVAATWWQLW